MAPLAGRIVIVTGASSGIGRATAARLARKGATVVACARDEARLRALADEVAGASGRVETRRCDVTLTADRAALVDGVLARHGRIDALVNNAGIGWEGLVEEMESGDVERLVTTNLTSVIDLTRLVLPGMLERRSGHVVMISSAGAWASIPPLTVYCATKYGVDGFVEGVRREVWPRGVVVSSVNPGFVATEWLARSEGYSPREDDPAVRPNPGIEADRVAAAVEGCLTRPYHRTVAVPRVMGLARLLALQPLRTVADLVVGLNADRIVRFTRSLIAVTTPVDPYEEQRHHAPRG